MPTIKTIHSSGFPIGVELDDISQADRMTATLISLGYRPATTGDTWQRTSEGLPICPKHGEVMPQREKQGDTWHSHRVVDEATGEVTYCRGYATKNGGGWLVDARAPATSPQPAVRSSTATNGDAEDSSSSAMPQHQAIPPAIDETAQREEELNPHKAHTQNPRQVVCKISGDAIRAGRVAFDKVNELTKLANTDGWGAALAGLQAAMA